uniref:Uncharacterized protein n=1 Tax=Cyprinus carpio TaxID=7962 RepID=A0A8C1K0B4_CYPCA
ILELFEWRPEPTQPQQCKTLPTSLEHHIENGHPGTHSTAEEKMRKN